MNVVEWIMYAACCRLNTASDDKVWLALDIRARQAILWVQACGVSATNPIDLQPLIEALRSGSERPWLTR